MSWAVEFAVRHRLSGMSFRSKYPTEAEKAAGAKGWPTKGAQMPPSDRGVLQEADTVDKS